MSRPILKTNQNKTEIEQCLATNTVITKFKFRNQLESQKLLRYATSTCTTHTDFLSHSTVLNSKTSLSATSVGYNRKNSSGI